MTKIPSDQAAIALVGMCKEYEIDLIQLSGDETYLESFIGTIREAELLEYGENDKIEITIMNK